MDHHPPSQTKMQSSDQQGNSSQTSSPSNERGVAISLLQECIESANAVVQTVAEFDDVQPLKIMNMHVEKEYILTFLSSIFLYALVLTNYCYDGLNFLE